MPGLWCANWWWHTDIPQGIYVISPQGKLLGRVPIPEDYVTNLAFGGPNRKTLYVTVDQSLWRIRLKVEGWHIPFEK